MKSSMTIHLKLKLFLIPATMNHTRPMHIYYRRIALMVYPSELKSRVFISAGKCNFFQKR